MINSTKDALILPREGEVAPWFEARCGEISKFTFSSMGGRWVILMFFGSLGLSGSSNALSCVMAARSLFDDVTASFFGVSVDPADARGLNEAASLPGIRYFEDFDRRVSRLYGIADQADGFRPTAFLLDPLLRVLMYRPLDDVGALLSELRTRLSNKFGEEAQHAPALTVPRIFEPKLCRALIDYHDRVGGQPSGVMRQAGDRTVLVHDTRFKRRSDVELPSGELKAAVATRLEDRLAPLVERAYGWRPTRVERFLVACYDAEGGGFFQAHRDNTTAGTAHRRLAVTINLNKGAYDGGELVFPEFGRTLFKPPTGGALVFGCGLLHAVCAVTRGRRYAFLPFLYDEAAAAMRESNRSSLA